MSHLKKIMIKHGVSQTDLAAILGRDKSVITNLFQGKRQLKADEAMKIAKHIGVPVTHILGVKETPDGFMEEPALIPFQHEPKNWKRHGNVVKKDGKFYLETTETVSAAKKIYALQVADNSMNLAGVLEGDFIISGLDRACKSGQLVVVQHYQGRGAKTLIRKYEKPLLLPHSTSANHRPLHIEEDDVRLVSPVLKLIRSY